MLVIITSTLKTKIRKLILLRKVERKKLDLLTFYFYSFKKFSC